MGGDGHARGLVPAVVQDPQLAAALHELVAVVVREEALPVSRCPHQRLRYVVRQRVFRFDGTVQRAENSTKTNKIEQKRK